MHTVFEAVDFAAPDLDAALGEAVSAAQARRPIELGDRAALIAGLRAAIETPLGPLAGGLRLRDVRRADRLDELTFELPLAGGDAPAGHVTPGAIGAVLREHLAPGDPLVGYAGRLDDPDLRASVRGYLTGSIDLVLRVGEGFALADYKTNWLAAPGETLTAWHHRPQALAAEMERAHYGLQALLYTAALHRYLRWRLAGYDPERHLAGVLYLFVRGMTGPDTPTVDGTPCGVFAWRPPAALVVALSDVLDAGVERRCRDPRWRRVSGCPDGSPVSALAGDPLDARRAREAPGLLRAFNDIGVLAAADVHVAVRLTGLAEEADETVALAAALAVRAPRHGHVYVDLAQIRDTADVDAEEPVDLSALPWPAVDEWLRALEASAIVAVGESAGRAAAAARRQLAVPGPLLARGVPGRGRPARVRPGGRRARGRAGRRAGPLVRRAATMPASAPPRRPRSAAASRSSPAAPARARRGRSRGSSRCWPSRRARRRSSRSRPRPARPCSASRRRCTSRPA